MYGILFSLMGYNLLPSEFILRLTASPMWPVAVFPAGGVAFWPIPSFSEPLLSFLAQNSVLPQPWSWPFLEEPWFLLVDSGR